FLFNGRTLEDGSLLFSGSVNTSSDADFGLLRATADGLPVDGFGVDSKTSAGFGAFGQLGTDAAVLDDGKIVMVGASDSGGDTADATVARLNADGSVDDTFGFSGFITSSYDPVQSELPLHVDLQTDGKILVTGL